MSKAKEYVNATTRAVMMQPQWRGEDQHLRAEVTSLGMCRVYTQHGNHVCSIEAVDALSLGRWLLGTFGEPSPTTVVNVDTKMLVHRCCGTESPDESNPGCERNSHILCESCGYRYPRSQFTPRTTTVMR